jgi:hypothetical protein
MSNQVCEHGQPTDRCCHCENERLDDEISTLTAQLAEARRLYESECRIRYDAESTIAEQAQRIEELEEGLSTIGQIRRTNLWNTCSEDCDDRCDHGASRDLIMQQVSNLLAARRKMEGE